MIHRQLVRISLIALALVTTYAGDALAAPWTPPSVPIPEPGTLTLLASGVAALGGIGWLRRRKK